MTMELDETLARLERAALELARRAAARDAAFREGFFKGFLLAAGLAQGRRVIEPGAAAPRRLREEPGPPEASSSGQLTLF